MEGTIKNGTVLRSEAGLNYTVVKLLGSGGQGEVYDVECNGKHMALKWYYKHTATEDQKDILDDLIAKGSPDNSFLWPEDMIDPEDTPLFGYIMRLRPTNYKSIVDMMKRKAEPSFYMLCKAAYNLTKSYKKLHTIGYSYRDISFGNLFFDPNTGDVLICDNDNVSVNGKDGSSVYGTPRFMAPEIVNGKAKPSRHTDQFSLAVLLFYMFMMNHPLEGALEEKIKCMDIHAMNKLYGSDPVFIFDPNNTSNRPVKGYHDNALIYWPLYPEKLRTLFIRSFTDGLVDPRRRVTEGEWLDVFAEMMSSIVECPNCDAELFFDPSKQESKQAHKCWNCLKNVAMPHKLYVRKQYVLLYLGTKIYSHLIYGNDDMTVPVGTVVQNPKNPEVLGIRNDGSFNWTYIRVDSSQTTIAPARSAAVAIGAKIDFGQCVGEFIE